MTDANTDSNPGRRNSTSLIAILAILVIVALAVRLWHDHRPHPPATPAEAEQRARENPNSVDAQLVWATALHSLRRDNEAETVFKRAEALAPNDARPINSLAILALEHRQPAVALDYFRASLRIAPRDPSIWRSMGFLLQKGAKLADAAQAFRTATDLDPNDVVSWRQLGVIDYEGNLTGVAISDLQRAVKLDPSNVETLDLLGDDALAIGNVPIAQTAYEQAAKLDANDMVAKLGLARVGLQLDPSPADLARIGGQIDSILAAKPTGAAYLARGQCDLLRRRNTDAVNELKRALKMDPHLITAHTFLSRAYSALGQAAAARAEALAYAKSCAGTTSLSGTEAK